MQRQIMDINGRDKWYQDAWCEIYKESKNVRKDSHLYFNLFLISVHFHKYFISCPFLWFWSLVFFEKLVQF